MGRERQIQKNAETRKAILDAVIEIGLEEGFDELSIRKITDRLGYSSGIIYHYFKDKQEILDIIHRKTSMEIKEAVEHCMKPGRSFEKNMKVVYKMLSEISVYNPDTFKLILLSNYSHQNESVDIWIDMIIKAIEMGIESGELRKIDSEIMAYTLLNTFIVIQMIIREKEETDKRKIESIFNTEIDIILNGILNKEREEKQ